MGKITGFKEYGRELPAARDPRERIEDSNEIYQDFSVDKTRNQAARCMDCGIPFCHKGCPLGNNIPDFNEAVYRGDWKSAYEILSRTNNFPEFTGRICPAPCEASCVLGINKSPVSIEHIEKTVIEQAFAKGYVTPQVPSHRTGKKVAVVGSGPAGLAAAAQLNQAGHLVTVFERADRIGGLLRYGIPDFKLEKSVIDRRIEVMKLEGIRFRTGANVGGNVPVSELMENFDAIVLCGGSTIPRDMPVPGRELKGVHFAMDFLEGQNRYVAGLTEHPPISAFDKKVVVIGGGDTGADCVGTANRQKASTILQVELMDKPPLKRAPNNPWPEWPTVLKTSSSHEEGGAREWAILTKAFVGDETGTLKAIRTVKVKWEPDPEGGRNKNMVEIPGTEEEIPCDLALLAIGFVHPQKEGMLEQLGLPLDGRGNVKAPGYQTQHPKVFAAGDMRRGQSLIVWAISEGREAARAADAWLMGASNLPSKSISPVKVA